MFRELLESLSVIGPDRSQDVSEAGNGGRNEFFVTQHIVYSWLQLSAERKHGLNNWRPI